MTSVDSSQTYDRIGTSYRQTRREDPRLAQRIVEVLGHSESVLNVGAGTGSYEPRDRAVVAVEPAITMIRQRPFGAAPTVRAIAEALPFRDNAFVAGLAILTIHHWQDWKEGLKELTRVVSERVVMLTWDPESEGFWLVQDYFPEFIEADRKRLPTMAALRPFFGQLEILPVPIPHDCCDGFLGAYWRRPSEYLREEVRGGISSFANLSDSTALKRLADDLQSGRWQQLYGEVLAKEELDIGYRLLLGRPETS